MDLPLMLAFGLVSSLHCVTMCGPLVAVASAPLRTDSLPRLRNARILSTRQLSYQLGRGITYVTLGVILGSTGRALSSLFPARNIGGALQILVGTVFVVAALFGLLLGRAVAAPRKDSSLGRLIRRAITSGRSRGMLMLGLLTGFLPCGVLYAAFARSLAADSPLHGGLLMFAFWLGSAPLLAAVGIASGSLLRTVGNHANVLVAIAMLMTGAWLAAKGITNLRSDAPSSTHTPAVHRAE
jgi:sulfite exporter TauE/SafE